MDDVAIVGAGLIGAGIAYELAKRGARVTVYDRAEPARAASWAGAGMLAPFSEDLPDDAMLALCRASLAMYPDYAREVRERSGVDPKFERCGTLHVARTDDECAALHALAPIFANNGGEVALLDRTQTLAHEPSVARTIAGALLVANEGVIDNRRLGRALIAACERFGVRFDTRRVRGLRSTRGFIPAGIVVNAAGAWAGEFAGVPAHAGIPVMPVAGEMLALGVPRGFARGLIWTGHTYLVPRDDGRLLIGATVHDRGFDVRVTAGGIAHLLATALAAAPSLADFAIVETWAGLRPGSPDGRPFLGRTAIDGYLVAAGHYRNGILLTPITARAIAETIADGRTAIDLAAFAPDRRLPDAAPSPAKHIA
jgi:glycine oxidase